MVHGYFEEQIMNGSPVRVAMVGLGFGAEFIPIYQAHPDAEVSAICRRNEADLQKVGDQFGIDTRYTKFADVLADSDVDFVHINSPIPDHAWMSLEALSAGKHVMCTVPMATTIEDCDEICQKVADTGLKYMMAETVVYSREFLFLKEMYTKGELGKLQYLAASHPQDMDGWPSYWEAMIPMHYATHVVSPCLGLVDGVAEYVSCFGSGTVRDDIAKKSGNKFAVESCHIKIKDSDVACHIWRFLYDVARQYRESFDVYGTKKVIRVDAGRERAARHSYGQKAGAGDSRAGGGSRLCAPAARADPPVHATAGDSRRRTPVVHPGRRPRRLASAPGQRVRLGARRKTATPGPTRRSRPTGPAWASAPTSRPSRAGRS